jgi:hypothetical protein
MCCLTSHYIFQPQDEEQAFTIGDNSSFPDGFWNRPLTPGRCYQVTLLAVNQQDNEYKYSSVKLQDRVQNSSESNLEENSSSRAVWTAFLLLLIIPAVVYFICRSVVCVTFVTVCNVMRQRTHLVACRGYEFILMTKAKVSFKSFSFICRWA